MKGKDYPIYSIKNLIPLDSEVYKTSNEMTLLKCPTCGKNTKYGKWHCCCWCGVNILFGLPIFKVFFTSDDKKKFSCGYCPNCNAVVWNPTNYCTECGVFIFWDIEGTREDRIRHLFHRGLC